MRRCIDKKIAVLTSGGDAPGMNACLRSIVLAANHYSISVLGFEHGYNGLINNEFIELSYAAINQGIHLGGTLLKSARCEKFHLPSYVELAANHLNALDIDALIVIGGDGSFRGLQVLSQIWNKPVIGVPGTIDNDLFGTDYTIGFHTAVETVVGAIDKIRDTADALERIFLVDVMGQHSGFIALQASIACGAEFAMYPESKLSEHQEIEEIIAHIEAARKLHEKNSFIMVLTENHPIGNAQQVADMLTKQIGIECRPCILGHIQRGGTPCAQDRVLATKLGACAVDSLVSGKNKMMVGEVKNEIVLTSLTDTYEKKKQLDIALFAIQHQLFDLVNELNSD
nr:ATP-dependent 6-phosphofructokinase [Marinifaba aquimaris]